MKKLEQVAQVISQASTISGYIAIVATWLLLSVILGEIFARTFLKTSLLFGVQVSSWLLIALVFMGTAWTVKSGGHVRINIITSRFSQRAQCWITVCVATVAMAAFVLFTIYAWEGFVEVYTGHIVGRTVYRMPLWWVWLPFLVGSVMLTIQFAGIVLENIVSLKRLEQEQGTTGDVLPAILIGIAVVGFFLVSFIWSPPAGMGAGLILLIVLGIVFALIGSSLWIFVSLGLTGVLALLLFTDYPPSLVVQVAFSANESFVLTCLPPFVLMGELLFRSGASSDLYSGISPWVERVPGRMLHSNILGCTIFAAISGSSAVTCATIGTVAVPELKKLGYDEGISLGSLAGAGTLGLLIPPSIVLIVYGAMTAQSIGQLFLGGFLPGLMLSGLFMAYIGMRAIRYPSIAPPSRVYSWKQRITGSVKVIPIFITIGMVLGLIYAGITTPTEAGAIGAACALGVVLLHRNLNWSVLKEASFATIRTTCMIMFIVTGATILSSGMAYLHVPQDLSAALEAAHLPKYLVFSILCLIYIALGCLFDGISMMVLTLPIVYPLILVMGFDPIWFGIVLTILIETAQITPPVGFNLYVLQTISGHDIGMIVRNTIPFFLLMLVGVVILVFFPEIAMVLPNMMIGQ